ncbi:sporulation protein [Amycolatopsis thermoflava]|uniref:Sporulation-control protein n=1 Tax=Amycolatopsis thermoflava TaxID=84480 RepID=A0A3N2GUZ5_9PSEU|nr:sporulation protein [Amycolatopsis thermoflava]ROS40456.1 sporulation-control protein [Amycolatopsis thermoflava]
MFKRMLSAFGVGGPSVDTVLDSPHAVPGGVVTGQVRIQGGSADAAIDQVVLSLVTRVEIEHGGHESAATGEFHRQLVQQGVRVPSGQLVTVPFELRLPWETPITAVGDSLLHGMAVGVRTELVISGAPDKGDLDPVHVHPLPSQDRVLDAFGQLGFRFRNADVEAGHLYGVRQELGFYQELEFFPPAEFAGRINEVELTFVAGPHDLAVVLEADRRGRFMQAGGDSFGRFQMSHQDAENADWAALIGQWLSEAAQRGGHSAFGNPAFGGHHPGHHGHHGHGRGMGVGGMVAGAAAGVVGGMIMGEMLEEAFEFDGEE